MSLSPVSPGYQVALLWQQGLSREVAEETAAWITRCPGPITVAVDDPPVPLATAEDGTLAWDIAFTAIRAERSLRKLPPTAFVYLLTRSPNEFNWFAAEDETDMRSGFGHVDDFSWITTAPGSAISAHYLLKGVFNALLHEAGVDWRALWHSESRGCLFDFCEQKADLGFKLKTGDICGDCLTVLRDARIPETLLRQAANIMDAQRRRAVNTVQFFETEPAFAHWPFPVAVTRHKVAQASNQLHRLLLLLDHFDSLVRFVVLTHGVETGRLSMVPERPALGWWVETLASVHGGERDLQEVVRIAERESIVSLRNENRGHGWMAIDDDSYRGEATRLEGILSAIEERLTPFLSAHRLVVPKSTKLADGRFVLQGSLLTGSNILTPRFETSMADPVAAGINNERAVYLTDAELSSFKSMTPWIVFTFCPECRHERLLLTDGGHRYIDVLVGHRVVLSA
jgi:hypothetical protein